MWFTDNTKIKGEATLKPELRTFAKVEAGAEEEISRHPWMAPGSAPVFSPCGVAGDIEDTHLQLFLNDHQEETLKAVQKARHQAEDKTAAPMEEASVTDHSLRTLTSRTW